MAGLSAALNIAKNALLTFQTATQVVSHNIANVSNEAYCRQKPIETTYPSSPSPVGPIGSGVKIEMIMRYFDAFLEKNINLKRTDYGLYSAEETGMTILETLFNEVADESGLTQILQDFWMAWQNLSSYPENFSARTQVIETGKLITEALKAKFRGLQDLETQIGLKLKTIVDRINALSSQIAELNLQISAAETGGKSANDLRDQRDKLVGELSQLASIQYFETKEGAYNIVLGKGFNLVELGRTWSLEVSGTDVYWVSNQGERVPLTSEKVSSGELGGWLRLLEQLSDEFNYEYVSGDKTVFNNSGELISESDNLVSDFGLSVGDTFTFSGTDHFGNTISGSFTINTGDETIRDFLDEIEKTFNYTVKAYIKDGRLFIEDQYRGSGELSFSIDSGPIDFGSFDNPDYQRRVTELNLAGRLRLFGEELIKAVNELHTQGVGLEFYEKELEGAYWVNQYIKELPYFLDLAKTSDGTALTGFFYIWVKDLTGKITPVKVSLEELSVDATLSDLSDRINSALSEAGFYTDSSDWDVRAIARNGRLVFQAEDDYSFAFSNDTSGILLATGINIFFVGSDPANFQVNDVLVKKPELIASGKMDVTAFRSEEPLFGIFKSSNSVDPTQTFNVSKLYIKLYDDRGSNIPLFTNDPDSTRFFYVLKSGIDETTRLVDLGFNSGDTFTFSGSLSDGTSVSPTTITIDEFTTVENVINQIRSAFDNKINISISNGLFVVEDDTEGSNPFTFSLTSSNSSTFEDIFGTLYKWAKNSDVGYYIEIPVLAGVDSLSTIVNKLDRLPYLRAYLDSSNYLYFQLEPDQTTVYGFEIGENYSGSGNSFVVDLLESESMYIPAFRWDETNPPTIEITGFESFNFDSTPETDYLSFYLFDENGELLNVFRINLEDIDEDGNTNDDTIFNLLQKINSTENAVYGLVSRLDRSGKLIIETTGLYDTKTFIIQDELYNGSSYIQTNYNYGFINTLKGYALERGDNRTAQVIADSATVTREVLNNSTLQDYYSSIVGEVGSATKSVKDTKSFLETLISQLKNVKESISGVSLDEEMANLIKYQQAFVASAKVLTTVEDMFEALIAAKR
ncbi:MAG: Flagellar hook-associated protein FlgK [Thermodesulfobacterium sp.]|uniref:Flagellar hook-associated protein 1 n=1 Tax=Candidatus Thermodesulfobacterium syntrophicum TaxID=3060442 RepID=A0AAE3P3Y2_9BACT|nr:Flagellar hook-associated protein FlgK [Candidatus Thermodesulfobacterium syntrophicum]